MGFLLSSFPPPPAHISAPRGRRRERKRGKNNLGGRALCEYEYCMGEEQANGKFKSVNTLHAKKRGGNPPGEGADKISKRRRGEEAKNDTKTLASFSRNCMKKFFHCDARRPKFEFVPLRLSLPLWAAAENNRNNPSPLSPLLQALFLLLPSLV